MVEEAGLEAASSGLIPATDGWFVVNVRDAALLTNDAFGARCVFEADTAVGAGEGPCVIFMTGGRTRRKSIVYPASDLARRHGAGVDTETSSPADAYAQFPRWLPERPDRWS